MADVTWATDSERLTARGVPALLVTLDGDDGHRVYFDAMGDPQQLVQCCATVLAMMKDNGNLAQRALALAKQNIGTQSFRVPKDG